MVQRVKSVALAYLLRSLIMHVTSRGNLASVPSRCTLLLPGIRYLQLKKLLSLANPCYLKISCRASSKMIDIEFPEHGLSECDERNCD